MSNHHGICRLIVVGSRHSVAPPHFQKQVRWGTLIAQDKELLALLAQMAQLGQVKDVGDQTEGMCFWCRKNRQMWVCKCLSCSNKKRNCPKFCGNWYYKQLFSCKKKTGSNNANADGNYAKQLDGYGV